MRSLYLDIKATFVYPLIDCMTHFNSSHIIHKTLGKKIHLLENVIGRNEYRIQDRQSYCFVSYSYANISISSLVTRPIHFISIKSVNECEHSIVKWAKKFESQLKRMFGSFSIQKQCKRKSYLCIFYYLMLYLLDKIQYFNWYCFDHWSRWGHKWNNWYQ